MMTTNNRKMGNLWKDKLTSRINHTATLLAIDLCLDRVNSMDSTLFKCQSFRTVILQFNLQTLDLRAYYNGSLFENDFCMRCDENITEDHDHVWDCQDTIRKSEEIYDRGLEILQNELEKRSVLSHKQSALRTIQALGINPQTLLVSPLGRGVVTQWATRKGKLMSKNIPGFKIIWLSLVAASLTRAFWEIIWIPRTAQVQRVQEQLESAANEEERQYEMQRKEKKDQAMKERGAIKRALLEEMRQEKRNFIHRNEKRLKEKMIKRGRSKPKKKDISRKRTSPTFLPDPKRRKTDVSKKKRSEYEKEIGAETTKQPYDQIEDDEDDEEEEIPILPEKRKANANHVCNPKRLKSDTPHPAESSHHFPTHRKSLRIQGQKIKPNNQQPTDPM
jgi:hypothetical protein